MLTIWNRSSGCLLLVILVLTGLLGCGVETGGDWPQASLDSHFVPLAGSVQGVDLYAEADTLHLLSSLRANDDDPLELFYSRSSDAGANWTPPSRVDRGAVAAHRTILGNDAQIAAHKNQVLAVWTTEGIGFGGRGLLEAAHSFDGGRTWNPGPAPAPTDEKIDQGFVDLAVDPQGLFHIAWFDARETADHKGLRYSTLELGSGAWSQVETPDAYTCECCWASLSLDAQRRFVLYRDREPRDMALASWEPDSGWSRLSSVGRFDWRVDGCPHVGGGLQVDFDQIPPKLHTTVWTGKQGTAGVFYFRSLDGGKNWSSPTRLGDQRSRHSSVTLAPDGTLVAVWDTLHNRELVVLMARSLDDGLSWEEPLRLSPQGRGASYPRVIRLGEALVVTWVESGEDGMASRMVVSKLKTWIPILPGSVVARADGAN